MASHCGASQNEPASHHYPTQTSYFMTDTQSENDRRLQALDRAVQMQKKKSQSEFFHIGNRQPNQKMYLKKPQITVDKRPLCSLEATQAVNSSNLVDQVWAKFIIVHRCSVVVTESCPAVTGGNRPNINRATGAQRFRLLGLLCDRGAANNSTTAVTWFPHR